MTGVDVDLDDIPAQIDRLHLEAEDVADLARHIEDEDPAEAADLRKKADRLIRQAARLRSQIEED